MVARILNDFVDFQHLEILLMGLVKMNLQLFFFSPKFIA